MKAAKRIGFVFFAFIGILWFYTNSLFGVDQQAKNYYVDLKKELKRNEYKTRLFTISGRRWKFDNYILTLIGSAAPKSKHKSGQAIDIIVLDINDDGKSNSKDVDIVYKILDAKIIKNKGGLGSYKKEKGFFNQQMIHFDCRGIKARWNR